MSLGVGAELRREVRRRAHNRCEYCLMPDDIPLFPHEPDHIIALKHRGLSTLDNLAYACFECNRAKGSDIASIDPGSGILTPLYSPRTQAWRDHFRLNGPVIEPLTAFGRVTATVLRLNDPVRVAVRAALMEQGRYPDVPRTDLTPSRTQRVPA